MQEPDKDNSEKVRKEALQEKIAMGNAFYELTKRKGWEYLKTYIENQIKTFANEAINSGFKDMDEFQFKRGQVVALRNIIGEIDSAIKTYEQQREKDKGSAGK